jgi:hypothetical protein
VLLYDKQRRVTEQRQLKNIPQLRRLDSEGYIFETEQDFADAETGS